MNIELNSFNQVSENGQVDLKLNHNLVPVQLKTDTSDLTKIQNVKNGDIVVLSSGGKLVPSVAPVEDTDTYSDAKTYGIVTLARKSNNYSNDDILTIALFTTTIYLTAGDALSCGDKVSFDLANKKLVAYSTSAGFIPLGVVLGDCVDGEKVRVMLQ